MLVFIGKLSFNTLRWVSRVSVIFQMFASFYTSCISYMLFNSTEWGSRVVQGPSSCCLWGNLSVPISLADTRRPYYCTIVPAASIGPQGQTIQESTLSTCSFFLELCLYCVNCIKEPASDCLWLSSRNGMLSYSMHSVQDRGYLFYINCIEEPASYIACGCSRGTFFVLFY